jgi:hypothetical protein
MIQIPLTDRHGNTLASAVVDDDMAHLALSRWHASHDRRYAFRRVNHEAVRKHNKISQNCGAA